MSTSAFRSQIYYNMMLHVYILRNSCGMGCTRCTTRPNNNIVEGNRVITVFYDNNHFALHLTKTILKTNN